MDAPARSDANRPDISVGKDYRILSDRLHRADMVHLSRLLPNILIVEEALFDVVACRLGDKQFDID